jgi:hypothetical protein
VAIHVHHDGEQIGPLSSEQRRVGLARRDGDDAGRKRLERRVDGIQDGSVVQSVRRCIREAKRNLAHELPRRRG